MSTRPNFIDIRSRSFDPSAMGMPSPRSCATPDPRLHIAGQIPPELSPLDAFAAQSRLLAKQLEQTGSHGRRASRLPPLTIASSLGQARPGYFRSMSASPATGGAPEPSPKSGQSPEVETHGFRPLSIYPTVSDTHDSMPPPPMPSSLPPSRLNNHEEEFRGRRPPSTDGPGYFGGRQTQSPSPLNDQRSRQTESPRPSIESMRQRGQPSFKGQDSSLGISGYDSRALAPPRSPYVQRTPSPRAMSFESSDDDSHHHVRSPNQTFSSESVFSTSPISPGMYSIARSGSMSSEVSIGGTRLPRPAFNFSRPLSRASMAGMPVDVPSRQASGDSQPSFVLADDTAHTPVSMKSEGFPENNGETAPAPSYVYSRFTLPRGKMLQRNSLIFQEGTQFPWEAPTPSKDGTAPPSPPSRPSTSSLRPDLSHSRPSLDPGRPSYSSYEYRPSLDPGRPSLDPGRPSLDPGRPSFDKGFSFTEQMPTSSPSERPKSSSVASSATIKAHSQHSLTPSGGDCSAEEHVTKAIDFHEAGALNKSTYHLRLAARQNHPTGMLLYALACRHGWGMRPNQREGVMWLRKAADSAGLEIAHDEDLTKEGKAPDFLEQKTRKAQFALSIYELGVSHMNGWGIEQDKVLALRCFEIAGSWGDADALAEAGFCYAQGVGCKKDLKKSAGFYRQAEAKGISMIGNSWIYKDKYNASEKTTEKKSFSESRRVEKEKEKKPRDKSRTRTIFGRMRSSS